MTGRLLTITTAIALSASLAYADQLRQRVPSGGSSSSSGGSQSGGSQSGSQSGGSQSRGSQSGGGQSSGAQSSGGGSSRESSGGSQTRAPREAAPRQAAPPPAPRQDAPAPAPAAQSESRSSLAQRFSSARAETAQRQEPSASAPAPQESRGGLLQRSRELRAEQAPPPAPRSGGSQIQRWGSTRHEEVVDEPAITERAPATPFFSQGIRGAVSRQQPESTPAASPVTAATEPAARPATPQPGQRVAEQRQRVPGPQDQPQVYAVPRGSVSPAPRPGTIDSDRRLVARSTTRVYNNYYYPRHNYPYGFGSYGLGYFYYDPYNWYDAYDVYPSYSSGIYQYPYGYATGEIRLQVRPRHAEVYVDGYYAGRVDEFDGFFQGLRIEEGPHVIEIVARGYQTLVFNVRIIAGRKLDYKANLLPY